VIYVDKLLYNPTVVGVE